MKSDRREKFRSERQIVWKSSFQNFHFREVPKNKEDSWPSNPHLVSVE